MTQLMCWCVCMFYLVSTQADVELVEVLGALGGEAGSVDERGHVAQGAQVKGPCLALTHICEAAVAIAKRVILGGTYDTKINMSAYTLNEDQ